MRKGKLSARIKMEVTLLLMTTFTEIPSVRNKQVTATTLTNVSCLLFSSAQVNFCIKTEQ